MDTASVFRVRTVPVIPDTRSDPAALMVIDARESRDPLAVLVAALPMINTSFGGLLRVHENEPCQLAPTVQLVGKNAEYRKDRRIVNARTLFETDRTLTENVVDEPEVMVEIGAPVSDPKSTSPLSTASRLALRRRLFDRVEIVSHVMDVVVILTVL